MSRPIMTDLADAAGVSLATVDRVLNKRPGVRQKTIQKVNDAINQIGYVRDITAANLARQKNYRFIFVIPNVNSSFHREIINVVAEAKKQFIAERINVELIDVNADNPHDVVSTLNQIKHKETVDGIAIMAPETPHIRDAIRHLKKQNKIIVAIVSDLPNSEIDGFVGINNLAAGRTAGSIIGRFIGKKQKDIIVVAGSMLARDHIERRLGFDNIMRQEFGHLNVLPTIETWDNAETIKKILPDVIKKNQNIGGIYMTGSGQSGLTKVVENTKPDIVTVAHELTPATRKGLQNGIIDALIVQDMGHVARSAVRVMRAKCGNLTLFHAQEQIRIEIIMKENLIQKNMQNTRLGEKL